MVPLLFLELLRCFYVTSVNGLGVFPEHCGGLRQFKIIGNDTPRPLLTKPFFYFPGFPIDSKRDPGDSQKDSYWFPYRILKNPLVKSVILIGC